MYILTGYAGSRDYVGNPQSPFSVILHMTSSDSMKKGRGIDVRKKGYEGVIVYTMSSLGL